MYILHVSAECFPIAKVGGLADVVGALPKYQEAAGFTSKVIMPFYEKKFVTQYDPKTYTKGNLLLGLEQYYYEVLEYDKKILGFELFLVKIFGLTDKEEVYGYHYDVERFTAFQKVVADFILEQKVKPEIIHCHDHHTGLVPFFTANCYKYQALKDIPTILTIHNGQYQGNFGFDKMNYLPEFEANKKGILDWNGQINPLAVGIKSAWKITTVSTSYLEELQEKANGLEGLLKQEKEKSIGILNGIDDKLWNPKTDKYLKANFNSKKLTERNKNKEYLCKTYGFDPALPLISFIGRFVHEKGSDLLAETINYVFKELGLDVNIFILGSGDKQTENSLNEIKDTFSGKYNNYIGYNEELAHIVYGGSDFLLMPSRVEPCGLNQMYALRYGTIPIVSKVGGLIDTITDFDTNENGNGIVCFDINVHEIGFAIKRAVDVYQNTEFFDRKRAEIMDINNGWKKSAKEYIKMYQSLTLKLKS